MMTAESMSSERQVLRFTVAAVSSVAKLTLSVREVWGSIPGPVKSTVHSLANDSPPLPRFFGAVLPRR